jgi:hypothetical protein
MKTGLYKVIVNGRIGMFCGKGEGKLYKGEIFFLLHKIYKGHTFGVSCFEVKILTLDGKIMHRSNFRWDWIEDVI